MECCSKDKKCPRSDLCCSTGSTWGFKQSQFQTWKDTVSAMIVASVNVRFYRFQKPLLLALTAGLITMVFTAVLATIIYVQTCRTIRSTVFLPFVDQQLSGNAQCDAVDTGTEGWLLSDLVSGSTGNFSRSGSIFYDANMMHQWQGFGTAAGQAFDMAEMYRKSAIAQGVSFGPIPANCTNNFGQEGPQSSESNGAPPCLPQAQGVLRHIGQVQFELRKEHYIPSTDNTYLADLNGTSPQHSSFTFTDTLTSDQLLTTCPIIKALMDSFMVDPAGKRLWPMWQQGPDAQAMVTRLIRDRSPELAKIFEGYSEPKKAMLLRIAAESRQAYAHAALHRTIPWRKSLVPGEQPVMVNQSCSWTMCMPRSLAAMAICDMFKGINDTSPAGFKNSHGRGAVVWGTYFDTTIRSKGGRYVTPVPTCCQHAPHDGDYWCASPSANAITQLFAEVLVGTNTDFDVNNAAPNQGQSRFGSDRLLAERIWQLDTRFRQMCDKGALMDDVATAEQMVHEFQMTVMGVTADMITNSQGFSTDYRRALGNVGLQCQDRQCMTLLSLIGTALGYATWLEIAASAFVLVIYFRARPQERLALEDVAAIAVDAPAMPDEVHRMKSEVHQAAMRQAGMSGDVMVGVHASSRPWQLVETMEGPVRIPAGSSAVGGKVTRRKLRCKRGRDSDSEASAHGGMPEGTCGSGRSGSSRSGSSRSGSSRSSSGASGSGASGNGTAGGSPGFAWSDSVSSYEPGTCAARYSPTPAPAPITAQNSVQLGQLAPPPSMRPEAGQFMARDSRDGGDMSSGGDGGAVNRGDGSGSSGEMVIRIS